MASTTPIRLAPVLAAALAALLLALAGPAGAAPTPSSPASASACVKATKKVRAAKSRLKAVQRQARRGRASRASVARARRAVKKAAQARRKACAAPAKPGVVAPVSPPPAAGGGSSESAPPPPPPPAPPSETSVALIDKALAEGRIDQETALRYRVFAEFGDPRLPAELRGAPLDVTDTRTLDEVAAQWEQLSAATRAALEPFFIPPFNPGSWYDPVSRSAAAAPGDQGSDLCANTAPDMNRWGYVTAAGGKVRVWYENTVSGQQAKAISVAEYLDSGAWTKVVGVFREPKPDGGDLEGMRCRGFDPALDMVLSPFAEADGRTIAYYDKPDCQGPIPAFALIRRELTGKALQATVVHELAHVTHYAYSEKHCRSSAVGWLSEATAAWTEYHVGGLGPDQPERYAPWFFDRPNEALETYERGTSTPRQYGAYLFFQWLAKNKGPGAVTKVWDYSESVDHPIDTTQRALSALGYTGGFTEAWKQFALAGLNPREGVDWFKQWGQPRGAVIDNHTVFSDDAGVSLPVNLPHLAAQYHHLGFSDAVKGIEVKNPFAGVPGASVQAWLRIDDGGRQRIEVRDLSGEETTTFCRELPPENVQEIALVIANSTSADRNHVLEGASHVRGTPSCGAYDGTSTTTILRDGLTEVYTASYTMKLQWTSLPPGGGTESLFATPSATDMHASWKIFGVSESDGCTYSGSASWPVGATGLEARLRLRDFGKGDPQTTYEHGFGISFKVGTVHRSNCPGGRSDDLPWQLGHGFQSRAHPWDPEGQGMTGSETQDLGYVTIEHDWSLSRKAIGPSP